MSFHYKVNHHIHEIIVPTRSSMHTPCHRARPPWPCDISTWRHTSRQLYPPSSVRAIQINISIVHPLHLDRSKIYICSLPTMENRAQAYKTLQATKSYNIHVALTYTAAVGPVLSDPCLTKALFYLQCTTMSYNHNYWVPSLINYCQKSTPRDVLISMFIISPPEHSVCCRKVQSDVTWQGLRYEAG